MRLTSFHHHQIKFCARKNHRPAKNTQNGGKKRTQTHLLCCQPKFTPLFIQKGNQNGDLKTGNVSPRTASVRGAWRNPTFCCVYCDLCPRTIAFLSLQILSGKPHGLFPIRRHYNRRFLQCQPLNVKKSRKRPEAPAFSAFRVQSIFEQISGCCTSPCACRSPVFGSCRSAASVRSACRPGRIPSR